MQSMHLNVCNDMRYNNIPADTHVHNFVQLCKSVNRSVQRNERMVKCGGWSTMYLCTIQTIHFVNDDRKSLMFGNCKTPVTRDLILVYRYWVHSYSIDVHKYKYFDTNCIKYFNPM